MRHLIIKALHRDQSFLAQGAEQLETILREQEADVEVRDLYHEDFLPVLTVSDFEAVQHKQIPEDIQREQDHIARADRIWVIFPIWWTGMPAILKGFIDRIFLSGFAYRMEGDRPVGLLNDKEVIILNSMGMSYEEYENTGMFEALRLTIDRGIFQFSGMEVIEHRYFTSIMSADEQMREKHFQTIKELARKYSRKLKTIEQKTNKYVA